MTSSMTAFTRQQSQHPWGSLVWEIRSVNHRYLEASFRLPDSLRNLEGGLRELLRRTLHRGKVEALLKFSPSYAEDSVLRLNQPLVDELLKACQQVSRQSESAAISPMDLLKWPGVIQEQEQDVAVIEEAAQVLFRSSLDALMSHRQREGSELDAMIRHRLDAVSGIIGEIREAMPTILAQQKTRIENQFRELQLDTDPTRLEQEIVLITQKADIHEEVDRLETHIREVSRILADSGPVGRRLDFLMQEMNREANTICSKAVVTNTTLGAIELKVLIEQMREQIQNIE